MNTMGENSESVKAGADVSLSAATAAAPVPVSCRRKKSEMNEGFVKDMMNHMDEFVHASYDEHKSCLGKTVRKLFGMNKAMQTTAPAPPPVISVLPLRVNVSSQNTSA